MNEEVTGYTEVVNAFISSKNVQSAFHLRMCSYVRDCPTNAFTLTEYPERGALDIVMKPEAKALWFQSWCSENNKVGSIEIQTDKIEQHGDYVLLVCTTKVCIDGNMVATDVGSRAVYLPAPNGYDSNRAMEMDRAVQQAASFSKGRALSNAGFGACCSSYNTPYTPGSLSDLGSAGNQEEPLPFSMLGDESTEGPRAYIDSAAGFCGNANAPAVGNRPDPAAQVIPAPQTAPTSQPQPDPIAKAKAMVWPNRGNFMGMSLGEILATSPTQIIWMASDRCRLPEFQEAAKLLLPEAKRLSGKA